MPNFENPHEILSLVKKTKNYLQFQGDSGLDEIPKPSMKTKTTKLETLNVIQDELKDCARCKLHKKRTQIVFGIGNPKAKLMFIGEGPGEQEDLKGEPFVGRAGQLLTKIIEAMGLTRDEVYIANIVKCRPPENRNPEPDEIEKCSPFLLRQISAIKPKVIVALGTFAAKTLLKSELPISKLRGQFHEFEGIKLMPTFHPAYLLRNPPAKKPCWEDMQLVMKEYKNC